MGINTALSARNSLPSHILLTRLRHYLAVIGNFIVPEFLLEPSPNKKPLHETAWLDGLRGVAALLVVLQHEHSMINMGHAHCYHYPEQTSPAAWPFVRLLFSGGSFAVILFFLISGYVVPRRLLRLMHEGRQAEFIEALTSAVVRRHGRLLMPAMLSALLTICFYWFTGWEPNWDNNKFASNFFQELWWWVLDCLQMLNYFTAFASYYNRVTWTIVAELKGSMALFAWLFAVHQMRVQFRLLATLALSFFLVIFGRGAMYSAFFAGMITCELDLLTASGEINRLWLPWRGISDYLKSRERARSIFLHSGLFFGLLFASTPLLHTDKPVKEAIANCSSWPSVLFNIVPWQYWNNWPDIAYRDFWWFWGAWLSAASIKEIRWARKLFETSFAQYLGRHSFSLYLTHLVVGATFSRIVLILTGFGHLGGPDANSPYDRIPIAAWRPAFPPHIGPAGFQPGMLLDLTLSLPVMFWVAEMGTKIFDRPSVRMSVWMYQKFKKLR
ncbi:putative acyltransferase 3 domain-containing protein [Septoria linicola]|nr:putative acyltransferase 3 domain-containing protein [Septoria linicola]